MSEQSSPHNLFKYLSLVEAIIILLAFGQRLVELVRPFDFSCGYTQLLGWGLSLMLGATAILFGLCLYLNNKRLHIVTAIILSLFLLSGILIGSLIKPSLEIISPEPNDKYSGFIPYQVKICNLRRDMNLDLLAEVKDLGTTPSQYTLFPIDIPWNSSNPIAKDLTDPSFFKSEKKIEIRFLLKGGGNPVASSDWKGPITIISSDIPLVNIRIDPNRNHINPNQAPYEVPITGTVLHAKDKYLYLIVDDGQGKWIQPGLGDGKDRNFSGTAYLGQKNETASLNKFYSVFAVVVDEKQDDQFGLLDIKKIKAESNTITLYRTK